MSNPTTPHDDVDLAPGRDDLTAQEKQRHLSERSREFRIHEERELLRRDDAFQRGGHSARTLAKHDDLRIVLIALAPGARLEEHTANARVSIQVVTGAVRLRLGDAVVELAAGGLLVLDRSVPHDVEAVEESAILLTLVWPGGHPHLVSPIPRRAAM